MAQRKIIQIAVAVTPGSEYSGADDRESFYALCDDRTLWSPLWQEPDDKSLPAITRCKKQDAERAAVWRSPVLGDQGNLFVAAQVQARPSDDVARSRSRNGGGAAADGAAVGSAVSPTAATVPPCLYAVARGKRPNGRVSELECD